MSTMGFGLFYDGYKTTTWQTLYCQSDLTFAKGIFSSMEKCLLSIPSLNIEIFLPLTAILSNDI